MRALPATLAANALPAGTEDSSSNASKRSASSDPFTRAHDSAGAGPSIGGASGCCAVPGVFTAASKARSVVFVSEGFQSCPAPGGLTRSRTS